MNNYFAKVAQELTWKNKLDKAICQLLKDEYERKLLTEDELVIKGIKIQETVQKLNHQHPRCKPISVRVQQHDEDYHTYTDTITIFIYLVKS
jgi:predicted alpha-1,6-mannanase (GH76 family)